MSKRLNHSCLCLKCLKCLKCLFAVFKRSKSGGISWMPFGGAQNSGRTGLMDSNDPRQEPQGWAPGVAWPSWILGFCCYLFRKDCEWERHVVSCGFHVNFCCSAESSDPAESQTSLSSRVLFSWGVSWHDPIGKALKHGRLLGQGVQGCGLGKAEINKYLNGFPFELQQIGDTWSILDTQLIPTPSYIWNKNIFPGCKLRRMVCSQALGRWKGW